MKELAISPRFAQELEQLDMRPKAPELAEAALGRVELRQLLDNLDPRLLTKVLDGIHLADASAEVAPKEALVPRVKFDESLLIAVQEAGYPEGGILTSRAAFDFVVCRGADG